MSGVTLFKVTSSVSWIQPYIYTYTGPYIYLNEFSQKKIIIIIVIVIVTSITQLFIEYNKSNYMKIKTKNKNLDVNISHVEVIVE